MQQQEIVEEKQEAQKEVVQDDQEVTINPYEVINTTGKVIANEKLIKKFGSSEITQDHIARIERLTGKKAHHLLRRGLFFSHRDLDQILDSYEQGKGFYLYTGRGPSSEALHVGHLIPFIFTKYLQDVFDVPLVIQMSDDEKFFHKGDVSLEEYQRYGFENAKDIIACGFDVEKTFIFLNTEYAGHMYKNICKFQKGITFNQLKGIFGLSESDNCGKVSYPAIQAACAVSSSFEHIFGKDEVPCLVPQGIDQDPYFRMARDVCYKIKVQKTACIHSTFIPGLKGFGSKMNASDPDSAVFLTDNPQQIKDKITKHALSGGGMTKKEHQENGANLDVDVSYHYLRFFIEDDQKLEQIRDEYGRGIMFTSTVKKELIEVLTKLLTEHQERRAKVTDEEVRKFMSLRPLNYKKKIMIKQKLEELKRERYRKLYNILPDIVAEKKAPSFFYYSFEPYVDFEELCKLGPKLELPPKEDPVSKYRRVVQQQARKSKAINMFGQQLKLTVDDLVTAGQEKEQGNPIRFQPYSLQKAALYDKGCITCGGPNISVKYHLDRHICLKCRDQITTLNGDPVLIFQDDDGQVCVCGMAGDEAKDKKLYFVDLNELKINGYRCYVTFSADNELICLLHDALNDKGQSSRIPRSATFQTDQIVEYSRRKNFIKRNKKNIQTMKK